MKKKLIALLVPLFAGAFYLPTIHAMNPAPEGQVKKPAKSVLAKDVKKWVRNNEDLCVAGSVIAIRLGDGELFTREELFEIVRPLFPERKFELVKEMIQFTEEYMPVTVEGATAYARQKLQRCAACLRNIAVVLVVSEGLQSLPEKIGFSCTVLLLPLTLIGINQLNFNSITTVMALEVQKIFDVWPSVKLADLHEEAKAGMWRKVKGAVARQNNPGDNAAATNDWTEEELLFFRVLNGNLTRKELKTYVEKYMPEKRRILGNELLRVTEKRMPISVEGREKAKKDSVSKFGRFVSDGVKGMIVWEGSKLMLEVAGPHATVITMPVVVFSLYKLDDTQMIVLGQKLGAVIKNVLEGLTQWFGSKKAKAKVL